MGGDLVCIAGVLQVFGQGLGAVDGEGIGKAVRLALRLSPMGLLIRFGLAEVPLLLTQISEHTNLLDQRTNTHRIVAKEFRPCSAMLSGICIVA